MPASSLGPSPAASTSDGRSTALAKKLGNILFKVAALSVAVGVTTWLACTTQDDSPKQPSNPAPANAAEGVKTKDESKGSEGNEGNEGNKGSETKTDAGGRVIPSTKVLVLPEPKGADDANAPPPLRVMPPTKSGRLPDATVQKIIRRQEKTNGHQNKRPKANAKNKAPPPIFPGTKAAPVVDFNTAVDIGAASSADDGALPQAQGVKR